MSGYVHVRGDIAPVLFQSVLPTSSTNRALALCMAAHPIVAAIPTPVSGGLPRSQMQFRSHAGNASFRNVGLLRTTCSRVRRVRYDVTEHAALTSSAPRANPRDGVLPRGASFRNLVQALRLRGVRRSGMQLKQVQTCRYSAFACCETCQKLHINALRRNRVLTSSFSRFTSPFKFVSHHGGSVRHHVCDCYE